MLLLRVTVLHGPHTSPPEIVPPIAMTTFSLLVIIAIVAIALVAVAVILKAKLTRASPPGAGADYELRPTLLTPAERSFAGVLDGVVPDGVTWFAKVRLGDVFKTRTGLAPGDRSRASNRINQKHVDFLLVRSNDLVPIAGIELDDSSHETARRRNRDAFVDDVFHSCHLPLLHVPAQAGYIQAEVRRKIFDLFQPVLP